MAEDLVARNLGSDYMVGYQNTEPQTNPIVRYGVTIAQQKLLGEAWDVARRDVCDLVERIMVLRRDHGETTTQIMIRLNPPR